MISKGEAIVRLKKMGVTVADDQSIVTIILPPDISLAAGIKDTRAKLKQIEYTASFCIRQGSRDGSYISGMDDKEDGREGFTKEDKGEALSEEDLRGSLISMDEDGQFTLEILGNGFL